MHIVELHRKLMEARIEEENNNDNDNSIKPRTASSSNSGGVLDDVTKLLQSGLSVSEVSAIFANTVRVSDIEAQAQRLDRDNERRRKFLMTGHDIDN